MVVKRTPHTVPGRARRGRPLIHGEAWSKVSVVLMDRQIVRLDRLVSEIQRATGAILTRAGVIRALVDGVVGGNGFDITNVTSEFDLRDRVASRFKRRAIKGAAFRHLHRES
jgi:hypothetical protein